MENIKSVTVGQRHISWSTELTTLKTLYGPLVLCWSGGEIHAVPMCTLWADGRYGTIVDVERLDKWKREQELVDLIRECVKDLDNTKPIRRRR